MATVQALSPARDRQESSSVAPTRLADGTPSHAARRHSDHLVLVPLLLFTAAVSAVGLTRSPQRYDDEGTYTAQAWAVSHLGELAHYTYWYDHPPLGWIQISAWTSLTFGFERYDFAVQAGRELMLVSHVVAAALIWTLVRRLGTSQAGAAVAVAVFALSPLSVSLGRQVYLDNLAVAWTLAAFVLALSRRHQLVAYAGAAACFAVACLTKETFALLLPFLAWQLYRNADPTIRRYALAVSGTLLGLLVSAYVLFAALRGEALPGPDHVSLWDGVAFQLADRDDSGSVLDPTSRGGVVVQNWIALDPVLPVAAAVAAVGGLLVPRLRAVAGALLMSLLVVLKPGYLPVPYAIVVIPFAAVLIGCLLDALLRRAVTDGPRRGVPSAAVAAVAVGLLLVGTVRAWPADLRALWFDDPDSSLRSAQAWIAENVPDSDRLLVDDSVWVDLVESGRDRDDVVWFYKADTDAEVTDLAPDGWRDYDWVLMTGRGRYAVGTSPTVLDAIDNSSLAQTFGEGSDVVEIYSVRDTP